MKAAKKAADKGKEKDKVGEKDKKHCTHCGRDGHKKYYCFKLWDKKEKAAKAKKAAAAAAMAPSSSAAGKVPPANNTSDATAAANLAKTGTPQIEIAHLYLSMETPEMTPRGDQAAIALKTIELSGADISNKWIMDSSASRTMCSHWE